MSSSTNDPSLTGRPKSVPGLGLSTAAKISNLVVQMMNGYTGRGPTKAWTSIDHELITVVVRDTFTKGERSLIGNGYRQLVIDVRRAYQQTMRDELVAGVERLSGRKVIAFLSDHHLDPDIAVESFVLEPLNLDGRRP
jgi:uncharacterized protein YbcI